MKPSALAIRPVAADAELDAFGRIVEQSLLFPRRPEADWITREGKEAFRLAWSGDRLVGGLTVQRMGQWVGGRSVPTAGIRAVAVAPEARAKGVAGALLRAAFEELRADAIPLSTLYPATQLVYRRAGYELAGARTAWRVATSDLGATSADRELEIARVETPTRERLEPLYRRRAATSPGNLDRNAWMWMRVLDPVLGPETFVYEVTGPSGIEAYTVFVQERLPGTVVGEIRVRDLVAVTRPALARLKAFFADHRSIVRSVQWHGATADPLVALLDNPVARIDERWDWMLRLVDVEQALTARGYGPGRTVEVDLRVRDELLPWNDGAFTLAVADGRATLARGGSGSVHVDVRGLASLYTGYAGVSEIAARGLLTGKAADLARLETAFAGPAPWMPDMF